MRHLFGFLCVCALGVMPLVGCSETSGTGGSGGSAEPQPCLSDAECVDDGDLCTESPGGCFDETETEPGICVYEPIDCNDENDCTSDTCDSAGGFCNAPEPVTDGTPCAGGACEDGECALSGTVLPCTEQGIRNAIAAGGGPYTFDCADGTTMVTKAEIIIDNDVILDGEGNLTVEGDELEDPVFSVNEGVTAELTRFTVTGGACSPYLGCSPAVIDNSGTLTLTNSVLANNRGGAGLGNSAVGTAMLADCTLSGNVSGGIVSSGTLTMTNTTVSENGNRGIWGAGGTMTLTNSRVSGNDGVGIHNDGTMTLRECTVSENEGRGIYNTGTLTVMSATLSGNDTGIDSGLAGGGIDNDGVVTVINTTITGNTAFRGGGIFNEGSLMLLHSTLSGNTAEYGDALATGSFRPGREHMTTIVSTLIQGDCDINLPLTSNGYNLESPGSTCGFEQTGDQSGVSAVLLDLQPLANNGGPTQTHAITTDSAAFNAGTCEVDEDQRGVTRPQGPACDVGAFEVQPEL